MMRYKNLRSYSALLLLFLAGFCGFNLISDWKEGRAAEQAFSEISAQYHELKAESREDGSTEKPGSSAKRAVESLMSKNEDMFGWIDVEGTGIEYPVMFTPDDPEYYLRRDFSREYSMAGTPFIDGRTPEESDNYIIYGHNMKNGSMFSELTRYSEEAYMREHPWITLTTSSGEKKYQVIAAFYLNMAMDRNDYTWFNYFILKDKEVFYEFTERISEASLYPMTANPVYGDRFITLVTCSYHDYDGRFVVIGREMENRDDPNEIRLN